MTTDRRDRRPGRFITVEGIEGVGKTTNIKFIAGRIRAAGFDVEVTREPGGTPLAETLRNLLLQPGNETVTANAELLMAFAARSQHVEHLIRPKLERGVWVLSDRFTDATIAYQGYGRGVPLARIAALADWVHNDVQPDLTLLLDADFATSRHRRRNRDSADRFESEKQEFFTRVRSGYLNLAREQPQRITQIDASRALPEVRAAIENALRPLFEST